MLTVLAIVFGLLVVVVISALTGYFVAQEFAYMAVDRSQLKARSVAGDAAATRALDITRRTSFMLSGAQLGITVTGLLVGYVSEPLIGRGVGELLGGAGVPTAVGIGIGTVGAVLFSTLVQMVFGELFPKNLAIARPEALATRLAFSTALYLKLFGWLIWTFDQSSNLLLRALKIEPVHDVEHSATPRDLERIVAESRETGDLPPELSTLLDRILDFPTRTAAHAMIPRSHVDVIHADEPVAHALKLMGTKHTRYPVIGDDNDDLRGVVHLHDLLIPQPAGTVGQQCRPPVIVPTTLPLTDVFTALHHAKDEMALVIDEYGGFAGLVTVEDMAEELVGEIADEHDVPQELARVDGHGWVVSGGIHLDELARLVDEELPESDRYQTLAGLVIATFGGLPDVGDHVDIPIELPPAAYAAEVAPPRKVLHAEVRELAKRVPSTLFVTIAVADGVASTEETTHE